MPVKRRTSKRRSELAGAVELLLAGKPVPFSEENRTAIVNAVYFRDPVLPAEAEQRACNLLMEWRPPDIYAGLAYVGERVK